MVDDILKATVDVVYGTTNPEIYHYQRGSHPGIAFYIKTIIPGPDIVNDDTYHIWKSWCSIQEKHYKLIRIVDRAYDWQGELMPGWLTLWLDQRIDIRWTCAEDSAFNYEIIDFNNGLKHSGLSSLLWFKLLANRHQSVDSVSYDKLEEISEFLRTYTDSSSADKRRAKLKVIDDDDQIYSETDN